MKAFVAALLIVSLPMTAVAQEPGRLELRLPETPALPDFLVGEDQIVRLRPGDRAPFDGLLLDVATAARWNGRDLWYRRTLADQLHLHQELVDTLIAQAARELTIVVESYQREIGGLRGDIRDQAAHFAKQNRRGFFHTFAGGATTGVIASAVIAVITAVLVARVN